MYDTRTKPNFVLAVEPEPAPEPEDNQDGDNQQIGPNPLRRPCACGAEATLFPLGSAALCYDCAFATASAEAATLQSIQIERTIRTNRVCSNCSDPHVTWQCPSIARRLFALEGAA